MEGGGGERVDTSKLLILIFYYYLLLTYLLVYDVVLYSVHCTQMSRRHSKNPPYMMPENTL